MKDYDPKASNKEKESESGQSACDKLHSKSDFVRKALSCDQIPHRIMGDKVMVNMHTYIHYTHTPLHTTHVHKRPHIHPQTYTHI